MALGIRDGVLMVGYGTVSNLDDLPEFLRRVRGGRPPGPDLLRDVRRRYQAIGGSPLLQNTQRQADALGRRLGVTVEVAMRAWHPTVEQVLGSSRIAGLERLCVLPMAPFNANAYCRAVLEVMEALRAGADAPPALTCVGNWGRDRAFIAAHAAQIRAGADVGPERAALVVTAHSLPLALGDVTERYRAEVLACAAELSVELGWEATLCFQSQGAGAGPWLGPDLHSTLESLATRSRRQVVVAPIGFLAEHLETLYDLDIEAARWAQELGLTMTRVAALGERRELIEALAGLVSRALG